MEVYFDNAATTPMREEVVEEVIRVMKECSGNPSSTHSFGRSAKTLIETARKNVASYLNAYPQEIIFTSGGTESDNMILKCAVDKFNVTKIITTKLEHHAILHTVDCLEAKGVVIEYLSVDEKATIDYDELERVLQADTSKKLVSLMHVNNEVGSILDLKKVAYLCKKYNAFFHTDAVQGVGHFEIDLKEIPIDFLSAAAHKFHGPKGVGFSFIRKETGLSSFIVGGGQERGLRAGTESIHNIVGMSKAMELAYTNLEKEKSYIEGLKAYFVSELKRVFPNLYFNGNSDSLEKNTYTLVNVALPVPEQKKLMLDFHLDLKGIACSKGSACQSGSSSKSHVLNEIQDKEKEYYTWSSVRFSISKFNTKEEIDYVIAILEEFNS